VNSSRLLLVVLGLVALGFVIHTMLGSEVLFTSLEDVNPILLLASLFLMVTAVVLHAATWGRIVQHLSPRLRLERPLLLRVFFQTWLGRYIPGTLPYHASRLLLAERLATTRTVIGASVLYESVLHIGAAAALGLLCLLVSFGASLGTAPVYIGSAAVLLVLPLSVQPRLLLPVMTTVAAKAGREAPSREALLSSRETASIFLAYVLVHLLNGVAFFLIAQSVTGLGVTDAALAIGAYSLGSALGMAVLFTPSGLGVREATIVAFVGLSTSPSAALLAAAGARAVSVMADLIPVGAVMFRELFERIRAQTILIEGDLK
jgi:glycosyltransferase 2 family protein